MPAVSLCGSVTSFVLPTHSGGGSFEIVQAVAERPQRRLIVPAIDGDASGGAAD